MTAPAIARLQVVQIRNLALLHSWRWHLERWGFELKLTAPESAEATL